MTTTTTTPASVALPVCPASVAEAFGKLGIDPITATLIPILDLIATKQITAELGEQWNNWHTSYVARKQSAEDNATLATQLANAKASGQKALSCKVSAKGAVSVYGLNARFPITLYRNQWERLIGYVDTIKAFIADHANELSTGKEDPRFAGK